MKRILSLCLLLGCLLTVSLQAKEYLVKDIPLVHLQDARRYVSNPDGILSPEAVAVMDTTLFALERQTGIQTLVVAVEQIEGGDCFDFAFRLGQENGVGQKGRDNGLVILLVTGERCIQFATGYGLEGSLPDAICKRIQERYMNPYFRENNWNEGMVAGVEAVRRQLDGSMQNEGSDSEEENLGVVLLILGGCFIGVPLLLWIRHRRLIKCPKCHKHTLKTLSTRVVSRIGGIRTEEIVDCCTNCGHTRRRIRKVHENDFNDRGGGGIFMGGGGFGGGGGGFSGGSFGGGSFGGGGAGSKF